MAGLSQQQVLREWDNPLEKQPQPFTLRIHGEVPQAVAMKTIDKQLQTDLGVSKRWKAESGESVASI